MVELAISRISSKSAALRSMSRQRCRRAFATSSSGSAPSSCAARWRATRRREKGQVASQLRTSKDVRAQGVDRIYQLAVCALKAAKRAPPSRNKKLSWAAADAFFTGCQGVGFGRIDSPDITAYVRAWGVQRNNTDELLCEE